MSFSNYIIFLSCFYVRDKFLKILFFIMILFFSFRFFVFYFFLTMCYTCNNSTLLFLFLKKTSLAVPLINLYSYLTWQRILKKSTWYITRDNTIILLNRYSASVYAKTPYIFNEIILHYQPLLCGEPRIGQSALCFCCIGFLIKNFHFTNPGIAIARYAVCMKSIVLYQREIFLVLNYSDRFFTPLIMISQSYILHYN